MKFAREKRLLLGIVALVAPLPLPLNEPRPSGVVGWAALACFLLVVGWFLLRVARDEHRPLRARALNLLGAAYVPVLLIDAAVHLDGILVRPMMHLALFALAAKLYSLQRERDKWHAVLGIFFVFVTSMATSSGAGIGLYLVTMLVLWSGLLLRFTQLHVAALLEESHAAELERHARAARASSLAVLLGATLAIAVPTFFLLPRLATPYLFAGGGSAAGARYMTGFSDEVSLDVIGRVRTSQEVALRIELENAPLGELRLRGATYDRYEGRRWERTAGHRRVLRGRAGRFVLDDEPAPDRARIWLEPISSVALFVPTGVRWVSLSRPIPELVADGGNGLSLPFPFSQPLVYDVGFADVGYTEALPPAPDDAAVPEPALDREGITPEIEALALEVAGSGDPLAQAQRIEGHLSSAYGYTLDFVGRQPSADPVSDFLFRYRSGHCEYFASAMVLMLRAVGIPARFVTGFLGSEPSALGYHIVRQSNAHAWVEAWIPGRGWQVFDPTPPAGRPAAQGRSLWSLARQAYDFVVFRWDRYVISYGVADQARLFDGLSRLVRGWLRAFWNEPEMGRATRERDLTLPAEASEQESAAPASRVRWRLLALVLLAGAAAFGWSTRARRRPSGVRAYLRLRGELRGRGVPVEAGLAPIELRDRVVRRFPTAAPAAGRVVQLYLRESYGGAVLTAEERRQLEVALAEVRRELRKAS